MTQPHPVSEIHVAVGVIHGPDGRILIARRPDHTHLGGFWEFPGGKLERGETVQDALRRELQEELAITATTSTPLIRIRHTYPEKQVLLDVWRVTRFSGQPEGLQGQALDWVHPNHLPDRSFPPANRPIMAAARLPDHYAILDHDGDSNKLMQRLAHLLKSGIRLLQFRAKNLDSHQYSALAHEVIRHCHASETRVLLNTDPDNPLLAAADGLHLTAQRLMSLTERPLPASSWVGASCHNMKELCQAEHMGIDFALLSPVLPTPTHPRQPAMGYEGFAKTVDAVNLPVYALGGLRPNDIDPVRQAGGQGIAGIRGFLAGLPD